MDKPTNQTSIDEVKENLGGGNADEVTVEESTETEGEEGSPEEGTDEGEESGEGSTDGDKLPKDEAEPDYKQKFAASTTENQRIVSENTALQVQLDQMKTDSVKLTKLVDEYKVVAEGANPDGAKLLKMGQEIDELKTTIFSQKEDIAIEKFVASTPSAKQVQEALRRLYRLNPTKSLPDIWKENFAPLVEGATKTAIATTTAKKKQKPTSGKGAVSSEPGGGLPTNFNEMSVKERKEILKNQGL